MDGSIQMCNRLRSMALKIVLSSLELVLGAPHRLQRFIDVRMTLGHRCRDQG
jgi:hypothetical protein